MEQLRSPWLGAFVGLSVVHLVLLGADAEPWDSVTKCLLAPLLVGWVLQVGGPRIIALALAFCFLGDLFLEIESLFIAGMAAFALGHVCFIAFFVSRNAIAAVKAQPLALVILLVSALVLVAYVWGGVDDQVVRALIPVYTVLLVGTAATALSVDRVAGIGGISFLVSDGIIAMGVAHRINEERAIWEVAIMVLYLAGIYLLATGSVGREQRLRATDCWPEAATPEAASDEPVV